MRKLILRCGFAPGDIIMLSGAVRDLHRCYPGQFVTDVRTHCPAIWEHNPFITPLSPGAGVEEIDCSYPLINHCDSVPYHCLHGFIDFLNQRLKLRIRPTAFKGDIHLSRQEKLWYSQVSEQTGKEIPFWIVAAGGKYDVTIKWWETARYQKVVDHFRGRVQFVQVGETGHHHPPLEHVIDLRGQTSLRELIRLVYHSQGVLCSITALMHLAAAVETRGRRPHHRPCVVVAGGREPAHWEAYPGHQFIHTNGALACCREGGCWKDRTIPLRDGDHRDRPQNLCVDVLNGLPRCMDMISPDEVIRRIERYFEGKAARYLSKRQLRLADKAIRSQRNFGFDSQPLNIHSAGLACDDFIREIAPYPGPDSGRGIVICAGGVRYSVNAWVCVRTLRDLGCPLPIEIWCLHSKERDFELESAFAPFGVTFVDASKVRARHPVRSLNGWALKAYALVHCAFREVLLLDADNVPVANPERLFSSKEYAAAGAVFWPDYPNRNRRKATPIWRSVGARRPREPEFETGQILVDKARTWRALSLALWFNANSDFYYRYLHGDKETFHLAFRKTRIPYALIPHPIHRLAGTMCQHDFEGKRLFQHRNTDKWDFFLFNRRVKGFRREDLCRTYLKELQNKWDGGMSRLPSKALRNNGRRNGNPRIQAVMITCRERRELLTQTLASLANTDWPDLPLHIEPDRASGGDRRKRQTDCSLRALEKGLKSNADYILFLEDDLLFNRNLRQNVYRWKPLIEGRLSLASLYNPGVRELACDLANDARIVSPKSVYGSQAFLLSRRTALYVARHWNRVEGMQDIRISRLAARVSPAVLYHAPSLVQHVGRQSCWGGAFHCAVDFEPAWKGDS